MVGEIFVTKGHVVKRMRIMGRGRAGISTRKWSHLNVTLREIDFDALIDGAENDRRRKKLTAKKEKVRDTGLGFISSGERGKWGEGGGRLVIVRVWVGIRVGAGLR